VISKTAVLLFTMLSLGGMLLAGVTPAPVSAQPADEEELAGDLLDDLGISEEELDNLLDNLDIIDNRLVRDLLDNLDIIDEEEEDGEDEVVWCYLRQGDERVCFETQEECQQALDDDDSSITSHCERFETSPPEDDPENVFFCFVYEDDETGNDFTRCFSTLEVCENHLETIQQREGFTVLSDCERFDGLA
jgi:hypothetical protein